MTDAHGVARDQLRAFIERIERLEEEKKTIADDIKDVYGEAKGMGFIPAMIKKVVALRKKDEQQRMEEEAILDTYLAALGMLSQHDLFEETPAATDTAAGSGRGYAAPLRVQPETVTEVPAQDGGGTGLGESLSGKSNAALPASVDAHVNDGRLAGEVSAEVVTVVGTESGTVSISQSAADAATSTEADRRVQGGIPVGANASLSGVTGGESAATDQPLTGGGHVEREPSAATHQAGGLVCNPPAKSLRPNCLRPENCGGYGSKHCFSCSRAAKANDDEEAA